MSVYTHERPHERRGHHEAIVAAVQTTAGAWSSLAILGPAIAVTGARIVKAVRVTVQRIKAGQL